MELNNKTVVLTGASGGIGRAIAQRLHEDGARLMLVSRSEVKLAALRDELPRPDEHSGHIVCVADIASADGRATLQQRCAALPGGIDILINAAGINQLRLFVEQEDSAIEQMIATNLTGTIMLCHALLPLLQKKAQAAVINIGSTFGSIGYPGFSAYCASKFGLRGFSEALRRELADSGVEVSYIAPRATATALNSDRVVAMNKALGTAMDDPLRVASEVSRFIRGRSRSDAYIGWPEKLFVRVNALLPRVVDKSLRKQLPVIRRFAGQ